MKKYLFPCIGSLVILLLASSFAFAEYLLVVSSCKQSVNAQKVADRLRQDGYSPDTHSVRLSSGTWYRVSIGPYANQSAARQAKSELESLGYSDLFVTRGSIGRSDGQPSARSEKTVQQNRAPQEPRSSPPSSSKSQRTPPRSSTSRAGQQEPSSRTVTLNWEPSEVQGLVGYKLYYDTKSGQPYAPSPRDYVTEGAPPITLDKDSTRITLHGLTPGKEYYFALTGYDAQGRESDFSEEITTAQLEQQQAGAGEDLSSVRPMRSGQVTGSTVMPGDVLDIEVPGQKEMTREYDVDPDGKIYITTVGEVDVKGLDVASVTDKLTKTLKKFITKQDRIVVRLVAQLRYVHVQGGIRYPGWYRVPHQASLEHVISLAGGLLSGVDRSRITIKRERDGQGYETFPAEGQLTLQPNDIIQVPLPAGYKQKIDRGDLLFVRIPQRQAPARAIDDTDTADLKRDLNRTRIEVDTNGYIYLPSYGHVYVNGRTPAEVEDLITERLPKYLAALEMVSVSIIEKKQYLQVMGHIANPGDYNVSEKANVQEVIDKAGGAVDGANMSRIKIIREGADGKYSIRVNVYQYTITGDARLLPPLHADDTLFVPITSSFGNIKRTLDVWSPPEEKLEEDVAGKVRIFGAVHNPGMYEIKDEMDILDLLVLASGERDDADLSKILVIRDKEVQEEFNFDEFLNEEGTMKIPKLQSGDVVYVKYVEKKVFEPKEDKVYYITGKIRSPGKYKLTDDLTIFQAIAMAGGMTEWADRDDIMILRRIQGKQRNVPFDYDKAIAGKYPEHNILLQANDTIFIP